MAVYSLCCPSPCALLSFSLLSDVWYLPHIMEGLGRIKKGEAGVRLCFRMLVSFYVWVLISLSHVVFHFVLFVCVLCTLSRDVCCFVTMQGCIVFWFDGWFWCVL